MKKVWVSGTPRIWQRTPLGGVQCPGCGHPLIERAICEALLELGIEDKAIGVSGVGCSTRSLEVIRVDAVSGTAHGHPPDVATAIKRVHPHQPIVFTVQGDGDCIAIGAGSFINAVLRAEKITIIMCNNTNFGTTGGQMSPTTLLGQVTSTTPEGRNPASGYPAHVPEMLTTVKGAAYAARGSVHNPAEYQRSKRYLKTAFQKQMDNIGLSFVEILSACPPDWRLTPLESLKFIEEKMIREFPLGEFKNVDSID